MSLGVALETVACFADRAFLADADEPVGQRLADGMVIDSVVGGDERGAYLGRQRRELAQPTAFLAAISKRGGEIGVAAGGFGERTQALAEGRRKLVRRDGDEDLAFAEGKHFGE